MKRFINIFILLFGISFIVIAVNSVIEFECLFKSLFNISCTGCGLTRSFRSIINLDFYDAFKYNILGIPIFIICIIAFVSLIIDIIRNDNKTINYIFKFLKKYYIVIIILIVITTIINNINSI